MCTLSWLHTRSGLELFFNRDESLTRPDAQLPVVEDHGDISTLMPTDPVGGGTWIAANSQGMVVALLNNYRYPSTVPPDKAISRGMLVKRLGKVRDIAEVRKFLSAETLFFYPPFFLLAFQGENRGPYQWEWDGETLKETWNPPGSSLSTSSLMPRLIPGLRNFLVNRLIKKARKQGCPDQTAPELLALHRSCRPWPASLAIAMRRKGRATVSLTHIKVTSGQLTFRYWPGHPTDTAHEKPFETRLKLNGSCSTPKESVGSHDSAVTNARQGCPCSIGPIFGPSP